ncbi:hypothetical protein C8F01DRAFT_281132 [Mycena amicta]|nr:hypothetical protein C8F01DRAFT_281132 [Mycena amicta]
MSSLATIQTSSLARSIAAAATASLSFSQTFTSAAASFPTPNVTASQKLGVYAIVLIVVLGGLAVTFCIGMALRWRKKRRRRLRNVSRTPDGLATTEVATHDGRPGAALAALSFQPNNPVPESSLAYPEAEKEPARRASSQVDPFASTSLVDDLESHANPDDRGDIQEVPRRRIDYESV